MWFCLWEGRHVFLRSPLHTPHSSPNRHVEKKNERDAKTTYRDNECAFLNSELMLEGLCWLKMIYKDIQDLIYF